MQEGEDETIEGKIVENLKEEQSEARKIKTKSYVQQPTQEEWDEHMLTHLPFRAWCPCCVAGRKKADAHRRHTDDVAKDEEARVPIIAADYKGKKHRIKTAEDEEEFDFNSDQTL